MDWLPLFDPTHIWHGLLAQTPTPSPSPAANLELLKSQLEFFRSENARVAAEFKEKIDLLTQENIRLSDSFKNLVTTVQLVLALFAFLGGLLVYFLQRNLFEAREAAARLVNQEVESRIAEMVQARVSDVRRSLLREEAIRSTIVDYYLPGSRVGVEPPEVALLRTRGFGAVGFHTQEKTLRRSEREVGVLDLVNWRNDAGETLAEMKARLGKEDQEMQVQAKEVADRVLEILPMSSVLVIYVGLTVPSLFSLPKDRIAPANYLTTLIGMVADAAYVTYGATKQI